MPVKEIQRLLGEIESIQKEIGDLKKRVTEKRALQPQELRKSLAELSALAWKIKIIEGALQRVTRLTHSLQLLLESSASRDRKFQRLRNFIGQAAQSGSIEGVVNVTLETLKELTKADRALVILLKPDSEATELEASWVRDPFTMEPPSWERISALLGEIGDFYTPLFAPDTSSNVKLAKARSEGICSFIMMPIRWREHLLGFVYVDSLNRESALSPEDLEFLEPLVSYASASIEALRLSKELEQSLYELERVRVIREQDELEKDYLRALFSRFVSPVVVERLASDPSVLRLGGHRQEITVLFADIRGFTSLSEKLSPEKLVETLNRYLSLAAEAILEEEGTLDKFIGDAVMAFFNAPYPQENHVLRAAKAALRIKRKLEELHKRDQMRLKLYFGIGINVGEAVVGNIGTSMQMNYTAIGDCVNVAKRLQEIAEPGQILISARVYERIKGQAVARALPPLSIPGRTAREAVYELIDILE